MKDVDVQTTMTSQESISNITEPTGVTTIISEETNKTDENEEIQLNEETEQSQVKRFEN